MFNDRTCASVKSCRGIQTILSSLRDIDVRVNTEGMPGCPLM